MRAWIRGVPRGCLAVLLPLVFIAAFPKRTVAAQGQAALTGFVVSRATGQPIVDATVTVEGSSAATTTNGVGRFELTHQPGSWTLVASAPGYLPMRVPNVTAQTPVRIELEVTPNFMERLQVTATKTPQSVGDVPAAPTTIIGRETMDRRGDQRLTDGSGWPNAERVRCVLAGLPAAAAAQRPSGVGHGAQFEARGHRELRIRSEGKHPRRAPGARDVVLLHD